MTDPNAQSPDPNVPPPPPQQPASTPSGAAPLTPEQDVQWGSFAHLGGVLGILPSLIIWLVFKDRGSFTNTEAKEALNFQITVLIGYVICGILTLIVIGVLLTWLLWLANLILCIVAAVKVSSDGSYRYPFALRLVN